MNARTPERRALGTALIASFALLLVAALTGCDAAWDGPGLLAQADAAHGGVPGGGDVAVGVDVPVGPSDVVTIDGGSGDVGPAEDVPEPPPEDVVEPDDVGTPDVPSDAAEDVSRDVPSDVPDVPDTGGPLCPAPGNGTVNPMLSFGLSSSGGLDLDHDTSTCSPSSTCHDGVDNALAAAAELFEDRFVQALLSTAQDVLPVIQPLADDARDGTFSVALWPAEAASGETCPDNGVKCEVILYAESGGGSCDPPWVLENGTLVDGDTLVAGDFDSEYILELTLSDNLPALEVSVFALQLEAKVELDPWGRIISMDGTLGGAIERIDLLDLIEMAEHEMGDGAFWLLEQVIEEILDTDIDLDGDGRGDALSFAIDFTASEGRAVGVQPDGLPLWMGQQ